MMKGKGLGSLSFTLYTTINMQMRNFIFPFFDGTVCEYILSVPNNNDRFDFEFGYCGKQQYLEAIL